MPTPEEKKERESLVYNLLNREIQPIRNWNEWLERWLLAATIEEMLGLLHAGFNVPLEHSRYGEKEYDNIDRAVFYLTIADGWADNDLLKTPTDRELGERECRFGRDQHGNRVHRTASELRQVVALKAFDILCLNFFRTELKKEGRYGESFGRFWEQGVASNRLFPVILDFFRTEELKAYEMLWLDRVRIRNLTCQRECSHNEELARNFLLNLARFIWEWKETDVRLGYGEDQKKAIEKRDAEMRARLDAAKPWMVEVLVSLGGFDLLREWMLELNKPCLDKLKEIALRNKLDECLHPVTKDRKVATLDEACYLGSQVAWLLKEHELKVSENKRLNAIREAERKKEEANRRIKELTPR